MDIRIKIVIITGIVAVVGGVILGVAIYEKPITTGEPLISISPTRFDFGIISMADGLAKKIIKIENVGSAELKLTSIKTSCMCTTAILKTAERKSPIFGMHTNAGFWSEKIAPGQSAELEVIFDPNAHGPEATGPVTRQVIISSNDAGQRFAKDIIVFTADVVK